MFKLNGLMSKELVGVSSEVAVIIKLGFQNVLEIIVYEQSTIIITDYVDKIAGSLPIAVTMN